MRIMRDTMEVERGVHGPHQELEELGKRVLTKVIPRLIRPMETEGWKLKPVLVHRDLWHGNVSVDNETKGPVLYDPCWFYGRLSVSDISCPVFASSAITPRVLMDWCHKPDGFSMWRAERYLTSPDHVCTYFKTAKKSEPSGTRKTGTLYTNCK